MTQVMGLFPIPVMRIEGVLGPEELAAFTRRAEALATAENSGTDLLTHTEMINPAEDALCGPLSERLQPHLLRYGSLLFANEQPWHIKELWLNLLQPGGSQFLHTHANSFASGIIYITEPHPTAATIFRRPAGGAEFIFRNDVPQGHYSADTWAAADMKAGDLLLYPSYLLHGVPPNEGGQRISLAFNAIPDHLDSLGYRIGFTP